MSHIIELLNRYRKGENELFYDIIEEIFYLINIERYMNDVLSSNKLRTLHVYRDIIRTLPRFDDIVVVDQKKIKNFIGKLKGKLKGKFYYDDNILSFLRDFESNYFK